MVSSKKDVFVSDEGMDKDLVALHDEYLDNASDVI